MDTGLRWLRVLLVALGALLFLGIFHGALLKDPGEKLFRGSGDGLKNYFVFAYHLKHDSRATQFEGMNQPFGEQIGYVDAQPALVNSVKLLAPYFPALLEQSVAIINLAVLISLLLTAVSLYLLLRHFGVGWAYAGLYGWSIVLPLLYYLRIRSAENPWPPALYGAVIMLLSLYLHPYTGMIALCMLGVMLVLDRPLQLLLGMPRKALATAFFLLVPALLFLSLQALTDHHVGRTEKPLGFFDYRADRHSILAPPPGYRSPLSEALVPYGDPQQFEGSTYLGLAVLLAAAVLALVLLISRFNPRLLDPHAAAWPRQLSLMIIAGLVLLAFAAGAPFSSAKGWLPWSVPFVGQFRSPGRFGWAGYYVFGVAAVYSAWWLMQQARGGWRVLAMLFATAIPALYLYESVYYHVPVSEAINKDRNVLQFAQLNEGERSMVEAVDADRYRAMIVLPNFLNGSDEVLLHPQDRALELSMILAYHNGLPMMAYSMARSSVPETFEQLGVLNAPWYPRPIAARFKPTDEFLMLRASDFANVQEAYYWNLAEPVAEGDGWALRKISAAALFAERREELFVRLDSLCRFTSFAMTAGSRRQMADGSGLGPWYGLSAGQGVFYESFDTRPSELSYHGGGAFSCVHGDHNYPVTVPPGTLAEGDYILSFWVHNTRPLELHTLVCMTQLVDGAPQDEWISCGDTRHSRIVNGAWSLFELRFTVDRPEDHFGIMMKGADYYRDTITIDEVLIRPADSEVFQVLEERNGKLQRVFYNGHYLTRPE